MTDKINSSLKWEGPAQRAQHCSLGWLKHVCRDKSLHPTLAVLCHSSPNDLSLQKLRFDMTKPEGPLASSVILLKTLEFGKATVCACYAWANEGKWAATISCPHQNPPAMLGICRQPHRGDRDVTCLPCFCWQLLQASHRCVSATKTR